MTMLQTLKPVEASKREMIDQEDMKEVNMVLMAGMEEVNMALMAGMEEMMAMVTREVGQWEAREEDMEVDWEAMKVATDPMEWEAGEVFKEALEGEWETINEALEEEWEIVNEALEEE